ncbi:lysylphosphatidylglycerol synthase transmembrane domain-containing protein [Carboxylicivirga sp. N1Y90]|uniref:lysylphosphatidylglycerol synthase transmembrane domain-containing protein n=1 Tax=Carboxylicivirga fragile TaxID=3417571 RepID=UPI003D3582BC|nr:flippase-like domain-containing protein [Marinilabiliaceae bacterium N1Y90]
MKKLLSKTIQYVLFPVFGILIIWHLYKDQKADEIADVLRNDMNFFWVGLSIILGILSHVSRAMRWQLLLEPVEKKPRFNNTFWVVMTGYLANLVFPRMGEVSRCGVLSKYEKMSFTRVIGTVVAERLVDVFVLGLIALSVLVLQFDLITYFFGEYLNIDSFATVLSSPIFYGLLISIGIVIFVFFKFSDQLKMLKQVKSLWLKFADGLGSIRKIKNKPAFVFHTIFIWLMYFLMIYVCFFSMESTASLTIHAGITILLTGSLGMLAPVQGGIGPWHFMVIATLKLYGVDAHEAGIFALVVHAAQNAMIIVVGLLAFVMLPILNKSNGNAETKLEQSTI